MTSGSRPHVAPDLYFVQLEGEPTARGGFSDRLAVERSGFRRAAGKAGIALEERYSYSRLWNGVSARVTPDQIGALREVEGVRAVFPVHTLSLDDVPGGAVSPDLYTALTLSGADVAQSTLGLTGQNVLVGVIDTGIDHDHPDLGGCFGAGCRVVKGYDFVGDRYDAGDPTKLPEPDDDPDDCVGHGTHVAGIIGARGAVVGVAPGVQFAAYRVFGCSGSAGTDVLLKAMERAEADGVRVVNLSVGSPFGWPESPEAQAANQLVEDGVVVVASIGNSGDSGLWAAGAPGNGDRVIGVASVENTAIFGPAFQISPHDTMAEGGLVGFDGAAGAPVAPVTGTLPLTRTGTATTVNDACDPLSTGSLTGQVALIRRGTCSFFVKATNAAAAGAASVVLYNSQPGPLAATVSGTPALSVPVVTISAEDGAAINARLDAGPVTLSWGTKVVSTPNAVGDQLSTFSSLGLTAELGLKPDIAAPGGSIYSTYPLELGGYASLSGTSMASPHVAGAAALLLQAQPGISAPEVADVLRNTAVPRLAPAPNGTIADNVHRQGAGEVRIDAAAQSFVRATPSKIALGESQAGPVTTTILLTNTGTSAVTYDVAHVPALSTTGSTYAPASAASGYASVTVDPQTVTVPPNGGTATISVTISADPGLADGSLYGGYLVLTPQGGAAPVLLRVPYSGFKGDYQAIQILAPTAKGYPWLVNSAGTKQPHGATFTLQAGDFPRIIAHLEHAARTVKLDVFEAKKRKPWGRALTEEYYPQDSAEDGGGSTSTFRWSGTTVLNKHVVRVPNGRYVIQLSALKALGDANTPADWESWTSPVITLNHP